MFREFARSHLRERNCSAYIADKKKDDGKCSCGKAEDWHVDNEIQPFPEQNSKWNQERHTRVRPTTAFGEIDFGFASLNTQRAPVSCRTVDIAALVAVSFVLPFSVRTSRLGHGSVNSLGTAARCVEIVSSEIGSVSDRGRKEVFHEAPPSKCFQTRADGRSDNNRGEPP